MQNLQDAFETRKWSYISAFSICRTVPLKDELLLKKLVAFFIVAIVFGLGKTLSVYGIFQTKIQAMKRVAQKPLLSGCREWYLFIWYIFRYLQLVSTIPPLTENNQFSAKPCITPFSSTNSVLDLILFSLRGKMMHVSHVHFAISKIRKAIQSLVLYLNLIRLISRRSKWWM